jgi:hypothetical protein
VSDINDRLDSGLGALIPRNVTSGRLLDILKLLADAPVLGNIVKPVALLGAWWVEDRKPDRVFDVLVAVREKLLSDNYISPNVNVVDVQQKARGCRKKSRLIRLQR